MRPPNPYRGPGVDVILALIGVLWVACMAGLARGIYGDVSED